jgi:hypothetical protein
MKERAFPRPRSPDDRHQLAFVDFEINPPQGMNRRFY